MKLQPIIGLEIHLQLKTKSKMFCSCENRGETVYGEVPPNTNICPVCTGQPGVLPVVNEQAIEWAVKMALALDCHVNPQSKFDRKHYFYPDLPKGYQISQYDLPIAEGGFLEIETVDENSQLVIKKINLIRLHLEEDAAKLTHVAVRHPFTLFRTGSERSEGSSFVDFNRAGAPLLEIVTKPEIRTPLEAKNFLQELRVVARYLGLSKADMEKGELRCDVNISLRPEGEANFYSKTEIKNLNSFKAVERALEYEIQRQTKLWEEGNPPQTLSTRGWNDLKQVTEEQRTKEEAEDYRYFPEPDLPPLYLEEAAKKMKPLLPELPRCRRERFAEEFGLSRADAKILTDDVPWANFTEAVFAEAWAWLRSLPEMEGTEEEIMKKNQAKLARLVGGWLTSKLMGLMAENKIDIRLLKITPENFAEFISLIYTNKINSANAQLLLKEMLVSGQDPSQIMEEKRLGQVSDKNLIEKAVENVIRLNPDQAAQYQAGKIPVVQFLIGKVMKETEGKVDPQMVRKMLEKRLKG